MHADIDWSDASLFPVQFDPQQGEIGLLRLSTELVSESAFLDPRMHVDWRQVLRVSWRDVRIGNPVIAPSMLFHTAFCGSTLLSRALQSPPRVVALREPDVLRVLVEVASASPEQDANAVLEVVLRLLARPWEEGGRCVIKPTNLANNLLPEILRISGGRAILLYSSLSEFVVSCCKKLPQVQGYLFWAAQHLSKQTRLAQRLGLLPTHTLNFVQACVLTWYAQMEIYADALASDDSDRLRSLSLAMLLAKPNQVVPACARWLDLGGDDGLWLRNTQVEFQRNAKDISVTFNALERGREHAAASQQHAGLIEAAMRWAEQVVAPAATMPTAWKPVIN